MQKDSLHEIFQNFVIMRDTDCGRRALTEDRLVIEAPPGMPIAERSVEKVLVD
jgi:hypothetical protein